MEGRRKCTRLESRITKAARMTRLRKVGDDKPRKDNRAKSQAAATIGKKWEKRLKNGSGEVGLST
jgi:hypothetical protein